MKNVWAGWIIIHKLQTQIILISMTWEYMFGTPIKSSPTSDIDDIGIENVLSMTQALKQKFNG